MRAGTGGSGCTAAAAASASCRSFSAAAALEVLPPVGVVGLLPPLGVLGLLPGAGAAAAPPAATAADSMVPTPPSPAPGTPPPPAPPLLPSPPSAAAASADARSSARLDSTSATSSGHRGLPAGRGMRCMAPLSPNRSSPRLCRMSSSAKYCLSKSRENTSTGKGQGLCMEKRASLGACMGVAGRMAPQFTEGGWKCTVGVAPLAEHMR
mmetsp:Transcript_164/g.370  ORF Transcript_164/g.370 Transcript_164/m.370 type:complete len:209 (-) Transcript_164:2726-3352(-)